MFGITKVVIIYYPVSFLSLLKTYFKLLFECFQYPSLSLLLKTEDHFKTIQIGMEDISHLSLLLGLFINCGKVIIHHALLVTCCIIDHNLQHTTTLTSWSRQVYCRGRLAFAGLGTVDSGSAI